MESKSNEAIPSLAEKSPAATAVTTTTSKIRKKNVQFVTPLVTATIECSTDYDRTAVPIDIFHCDVCGMTIPAGIRGFEPYATCEICHNSPESDGFDLCGACCGTNAILQLCQQHYLTMDDVAMDFEKDRPTILVERHHPHELVVIDRKAQVLWANNNNIANNADNNEVGDHTPKRGKRSPRKTPRSMSPRKKSKSSPIPY